MSIFTNKFEELRHVGFIIGPHPNGLTIVGHKEPFYYMNAFGRLELSQKAPSAVEERYFDLGVRYCALLAGQYIDEIPWTFMSQEKGECLVNMIKMREQLENVKAAHFDLYQQHIALINKMMDMHTPMLHEKIMVG